MRLTRLLLARGFRRRDGILAGYHPQPELKSALGKYTKDFANLPERYVIRKSTKLIYKSEPNEPATPPDLELTPLMHHGTDRPWSDQFWAKYQYDHEDDEFGYIVEPIREEDWMWFRGDRVQIMTGPDSGKQGYINFIVQERNWVTVEGLNCKRIIQGQTKNFPGVCLIKEMPLLVTEEIKLVDPTDEQPTDVEWRFTEDGERIRVSTRSGSIIPKPTKSEETVDYKHKSNYVEHKVKDTAAKAVEEITYEPKLCTFEMDIMDKLGIKESRIPKKTFWY